MTSIPFIEDWKLFFERKCRTQKPVGVISINYPLRSLTIHISVKFTYASKMKIKKCSFQEREKSDVNRQRKIEILKP